MSNEEYFGYMLTDEEVRELEESIKLFDPFEVEARNEVDGIHQTSNARKAFLAKVRNRYAEEIKDDPEKLLEEIHALCMSRANFIRMQKARKAINDLAKVYGEPETKRDLGQGEKSYIAQVTENAEAFLYWLDKLGMKAAGEQVIKDAARKAYERKKKDPEPGYFNLPQGPAIHSVIEAIAHVNALDLWAYRSNQITKRKKGAGVSVAAYGGHFSVAARSDNADITIELKNIESLSEESEPFFVYLLSLINEQAISANKSMIKGFITLEYKTMAAAMGYGRPDEARRAFNKLIPGIRAIELCGVVKTYGKNARPRNISDISEQMFVGVERFSGGVNIRLSDGINWAVLMPYISIMPNYFYELPKNARRLLSIIAYKARQSKRSDGYIELSLSFVHNALGLPDEERTRKKGEKIQFPIEKAVADVLTYHKKAFPGDPMDIAINAPLDCSVADWLHHGKMIVKLPSFMTYKSSKQALKDA